MRLPFGKSVFALLLAASSLSMVEGAESFLKEDDFRSIPTPGGQADAWAACSASYELAASLLAEDSPALAAEYHNLANGARVAIYMTIFFTFEEEEGASPESNHRRLEATQKDATLLSDELPKVHFTSQLARLETSLHEGVAELTETVEICRSQLEHQQIWIDAWRELRRSGIFE